MNFNNKKENPEVRLLMEEQPEKEKERVKDKVVVGISVQEIRKMVTNAKIPVHVVYEGKESFKMVPRFSYFDSIATMILQNNDCNFSFIYRYADGRETVCDDRFSVGIVYDMIDPDTLPWRIELRRAEGSRKDYQQHHINALKQAEYLETGSISGISNLSKQQYRKIHSDIQHEEFTCPFTYDLSRERAKVATRIHFADGTSLVRRMDQNDSVFGIIQGIPVSHVRLKDILYLKNVDNWMHICFPNASVNASNYISSKKLLVTFRAVGSTPQIAKNVVKISSASTIGTCKEYVQKLLSAETQLFFYFEGLFSTEDAEILYNLCPDGVDRLSLFYSIDQAWV